jgi:threonine dehydrogenase-like Zn-dependent dehydrogenase
VHAHHGPAAKQARERAKEFEEEQTKVMRGKKPKTRGDSWHPGDAPSQALRWAVASLAKAGALGIIGVYPETMESFPIG